MEVIGDQKAAGKVLLPVVSTTSQEGGKQYIVMPTPTQPPRKKVSLGFLINMEHLNTFSTKVEETLVHETSYKVCVTLLKAKYLPKIPNILCFF